MAERVEAAANSQERLVLSQGGRELVSLGRKGMVVCCVLFAALTSVSGLRHLNLALNGSRGERLMRELAVCGAERQECRDRVTVEHE